MMNKSTGRKYLPVTLMPFNHHSFGCHLCEARVEVAVAVVAVVAAVAVAAAVAVVVVAAGVVVVVVVRLMDKILHDLRDPKLWELWHIPSYGSCRILSINRSSSSSSRSVVVAVVVVVVVVVVVSSKQ